MSGYQRELHSGVDYTTYTVEMILDGRRQSYQMPGPKRQPAMRHLDNEIQELESAVGKLNPHYNLPVLIYGARSPTLDLLRTDVDFGPLAQRLATIAAAVYKNYGESGIKAFQTALDAGDANALNGVNAKLGELAQHYQLCEELTLPFQSRKPGNHHLFEDHANTILDHIREHITKRVREPNTIYL